MKEVIAALVKAKAQFNRVVKSAEADTGKYTYKYADLETVLDAVEPALTANGLLITQPTVVIGGNTILNTVLTHVESDEKIVSAWKLPDLPDPQKMGSALTYARRYCILSLLGLAPEDDDGATAARPAPVKADTTPAVDYEALARQADTLDALKKVQQRAAAAGEWVAGSPLEKTVIARKGELEEATALKNVTDAGLAGSGAQ